MPAWSPLLKKVLIVGIPTATTVGYFLNNTVAAEDPSVHRQLNDELHQATVKQSSEKNKESTLEKALTLEQAQRKTRDLSHQSLIINGYPGIVFGVSYKGKPIWVHGFGYENLETNKKCSKDTVMRIASISKPLTMLIVAKLVEEGKLDLDKNINEYLGDKFPHKKFNNKTVNITLRQLASHFSGVRSYHPGEVLKLNSYYENAVEAMELFKNDDLLSESGSKFTHSTFAYTVIAAVVESVLPDNQTFGDYLIKVCRHDLGMTSTYLDNNSNIILNRAGQYTRKDGKLYNSPYVDCSYKYAGGGILSTIPDLLRFGNIMLYSYLDDGKSPGYLKSSTVDLLWSPIENSNITLLPDYKSWSSYGLGWGIIKNARPKFRAGNSPPFENIYYHTGGATGGTSLLMIIPEQELVVALFANLNSAPGLMWLGVSIAKIFSSYVTGLKGAEQGSMSNGKLVNEEPEFPS